MNELEEYALKALEQNKANGIENPLEVVEPTDPIEPTTNTVVEPIATSEPTVVDPIVTEGIVETSTEPISFLDKISSLNEPPKPTEISEERKAELALIEKYKKFEETDLAKLFETNLTPLDLAKAVSIVDYSAMSPENLIEAETKLSMGARYNEEAFNEELDYYNSLPTQKQKFEYEQKLIDKLGKNQVEINNELAKIIQEHQSAKAPIENKNYQAEIQKVAEAEKQSLETTLTELTTSYGLEKQTAEGIKNLYSFELAAAFVDPKTKKFNEVDFVKTAYKIVSYDKDIASLKEQMANAVVEAEKKAYEKAKKEFTGTEGIAGATETTPTLTPDELYKLAMQGR